MTRFCKYFNFFPPLILAFFLTVFIACSKKKEIDNDDTKVNNSVSVTDVKIVTVKRKHFQYQISINGKIEAAKEVKVQVEMDGIIEKINVTNGTSVFAGQVLASLDNKRYQLELNSAAIQLKEKQISYQDLTIGFRYGSNDTLKIIRDNIHISSGLAEAENSFEKAKFVFENSIIKTPIAGIVSNMNLKDGSFAKNGDELCTIHNPNELLVACQILEADAFVISNSNTAIIQPLFDQERQYKAHVNTVNPRVDIKTGLVDIKLSIEKPIKLYPGMNVAVIIKIPTRKSIVVPKEAVLIRSGKQVVFTEEKGIAKWNYVTLGRENGLEVEVLDGLHENDHVIIANNIQLAHDTPVKSTEL